MNQPPTKQTAFSSYRPTPVSTTCSGLPEATDIGAKVNEAMRDIEKQNPQLGGVLPKTYNLFTSTLLKELLKKVSEIPPASTTTRSVESTNTSSVSLR
jgi:type I restriction-modification system DNA methylase subunit